LAPIRTFSLVEEPDIVMVLDEALLKVVDVTAGIQSNGLVVVNTMRKPESFELSSGLNVATTNASGWAKEAGLVIAETVLFNTSMLGGFARATGLVSLENIERALRSHFRGEAAERNVQGARLTYAGTALLRECELACA